MFYWAQKIAEMSQMRMDRTLMLFLGMYIGLKVAS